MNMKGRVQVEYSQVEQVGALYFILINIVMFFEKCAFRPNKTVISMPHG